MSEKYKRQEREVRFLARAKERFGNLYDYSKVEFKNNFTKVELICNIHGSFFQTPKNHLIHRGCPKCTKEITAKAQSRTKEEYLEIAKQVHTNKFDYSKVENPKTGNRIVIICPIHGEFTQEASSHVRGAGCLKCAKEERGKAVGEMARKKKLTNDIFINRAKKVHGNKYEYSKVEYTGIQEDVIITCPRHGDFLQKPLGHMYGQGCRKCVSPTSSGERELTAWLNSLDIKTARHKIERYELDIYLPELNTAIEYNGLYWHRGEKKGSEYHLMKTNLCKDQGIKLIHIFEDEWVHRREDTKRILLALLGREQTGEQPQELKTSFKQIDKLGKAWEVTQFEPSNDFKDILQEFTSSKTAGRIVLYEDLRFPSEEFLTNLGFVKTDTYQPGYYWCKGSIRLDYQKKSLRFETEAPEEKCFKIYDCGYQKWELII